MLSYAQINWAACLAKSTPIKSAFALACLLSAFPLASQEFAVPRKRSWPVQKKSSDAHVLKGFSS